MHVENLHPASFRGAGFLVPRDTTTEGRNSIVHDYPDQAMRYVEDNGALPPCFDITAILHGPDLSAQLNRLRSALTRPGPGVLKHPIFGTSFVMVDQTYSIRHTQRNSGIIELNIKFITTGAPIFPALVSGIAAVVSQIGSDAVQQSFAAFISAYNAPSSPTSLMAIGGGIRTIIGQLVSSFNQVSGDATQIYKKAGIFSKEIELSGDLWFDAYRAPIRDETIPSGALLKRFNLVRLKAQTIVEQANAITPDTIDLEQRRTALLTIGEFNEFAAFVCMAEAAASREYETSDQVDADETLLLSAYNELQERGLPAEQHTALTNIYIATSDILHRASVRLPKITAIDAGGTPASVLAYQLYETDGLNNNDLHDKVPVIVALNPNKNPSLLGDDTNILTRAVNV